jgi:predicted transcriptional regulator
MKIIEIAHIDNEDIEYVNAFIIVGMKEIEAKVLIHIYNVKEATQRDIERYTDIPQSNVSIATQQLVEKGYIKTETINKEGIGRSTNMYMLNMSMKKIIVIIKIIFTTSTNCMAKNFRIVSTSEVHLWRRSPVSILLK